MYIFILAGGNGVRLWPLSSRQIPKQFLKLGEEQSLLQKTVSRFLRVSFVQEILVGVNELHSSVVKKQLDELILEKPLHIVNEPCRRNTAPAIALVVKYLEDLGVSPDETVCVVPSDHWLDSVDELLSSLEEAEKNLQTQIGLFGISPTRAESTYGYIQVENRGADQIPYPVTQFIEKPSLQRAKRFFKSKYYFWNTGIFIFRIGVMREQFEKHAPQISKHLQGSFAQCQKQFYQMPSISFDCAILEKSRQIVVYPLSVEWSDIGSWDRLYQQLNKDRNQNVKQGSIVDIDVENSLILSERLLICALGVKDLIIVEHAGILLICEKSRALEVRRIEKAADDFQMLDSLRLTRKRGEALRNESESKNQ